MQHSVFVDEAAQDVGSLEAASRRTPLVGSRTLDDKQLDSLFSPTRPPGASFAFRLAPGTWPTLSRAADSVDATGDPGLTRRTSGVAQAAKKHPRH